MIGKTDNGCNFPQKFLLTNTQILGFVKLLQMVLQLR